MSDGIGNQTELKLILSADGTVAIAGMRQVQDATRQHVDASKSMLDELQNRWAVYSAGVIASYETIKQCFDFAIEGAKIQQTQEAFANATASMQVNAKELLGQLDAMANGTVDDATLMQTSMSLMVRGMSAGQLPQIMEAARVAARTMGVDVSQAYTDIGNAVEMMRSRTLLSYGLITPEQVKLITALKNSGNEAEAFRLIMANVHVQEAKMGGVRDNEYEHWQQYKAQLKENVEWYEKLIAKMADYLLMSQRVTTQADEARKSSGLLQGEREYDAARFGGAYATTAAAQQQGVGYLPMTTAPATQSLDQANAELAAEKKRADALANVQKLQKAHEELAKAQLEWKKATDATDPSLTEEQKRIQAISDTAAILHQQYDKLGDTSWINAGRDQQIKNVALAQDQNNLLNQREAALKSYDTEMKASLQAAQDAAAADLKGSEDVIKAKNQQIDLEVKWGQMTAAEGTEAKYQDELKLLQAQIDEKQRLVLAELVYGNESAESERARTKAVEALNNAQNQLAAAIAKRGDVDREEYMQELQHDAQLLAEDVKRRESIKQGYETLFQELQKLSAIGGATGSSSQGVSQMLGSAQNIAAFKTGNDPYSQELDRAKKHYNDMLQLQAQGRASQLQVDKAYDAQQSAQDTASQQAKLGMVSNTFGMLAGMADTFYELSNSQSRAAFMAYKAFSLAQAIISGIAAVQHAYTWGTEWGGPAGGALMAAIAAAASMANIMKIVQQQPPSASTSSAPSLAGTSTSVPALPAMPAPASTPASPAAAPAAQRPITVVLNVYGSLTDYNAFARQALPAIRKAISDGA